MKPNIERSISYQTNVILLLTVSSLPLCLSVSLPSVDKMHLMLTELCCCYSLCADFVVFNHAITPTEFLLSHLEIRLSE